MEGAALRDALAELARECGVSVRVLHGAYTSVLSRIVRASCPPEGLVLDFFAGSGTAGAAALLSQRRFLLVDESHDAFAVMQRRFAREPTIRFESLR